MPAGSLTCVRSSQSELRCCHLLLLCVCVISDPCRAQTETCASTEPLCRTIWYHMSLFCIASWIKWFGVVFFCLFQVTVIWRKSDCSPFLVCQTHAWQITRQRRGQKSLRYRMVVQLICSALFVISFCKMGIVLSAQQIVPASLVNRLLSFQLINIQHTRCAKGINNQQGICGYL